MSHEQNATRNPIFFENSCPFGMAGVDIVLIGAFMKRVFHFGPIVNSTILTFLLATSLSAQTAPAERKVTAATRLDWQFAAQGFGAAAGKLPANYDSAKQRYHLFVPKSYRKDKPAALV